ncbi:MAG: hypothetical protein P8R01_01545 [Gammaproteobacteria bacterium]|nr:hypothetical protein [Gammaproteobacteria bacterium]
MPWRRLKTFVVAAAMIGFASLLINAVVSVYPTGTTIYQPDKTWGGFTLLDTADGDGGCPDRHEWKYSAVLGEFRIPAEP